MAAAKVRSESACTAENIVGKKCGQTQAEHGCDMGESAVGRRVGRLGKCCLRAVDAAEFATWKDRGAAEARAQRASQRAAIDLPEFGHGDLVGIDFTGGTHRREESTPRRSRPILGHKVGDRVTVKVSDTYSYDLLIKSIENTADDDDELRSY